MSEPGPTEDQYAATLELLSSLITQDRRGAGQWETVHEYMGSWVQRLGLERPLEKLSVIHVAGTKGKGSTCAMIESILRSCGYTTGLFTSPHLVDVRERIRLNGLPISKEKFVASFAQCHDRLKETSDGQIGMAAYFRFLTLLGLQVFTEEKVDVAILEVGLGGRLDATNCIPSPPVCGVTSLGMDHVEILGDTIEKIAAEKAGIFKPGSRAFTVIQQPSAMQVLEEKAASANIKLSVARAQVIRDPTSPDMGPGVTFYLDGAHTEESMASCGEWFHDAVQQAAALTPGLATQRVLLFNCMQERDPGKLLKSLATTMQQQQLPFHHAVFTPPDSQYGKLKAAGIDSARDVSWQHTLCRAWTSQVGSHPQESQLMAVLPELGQGPAQDSQSGAVAPGLSSSIQWLRTCAQENPHLQIEVLITGSLYLVGDVLKLLGKAPT
ncbi:hypothetical protein WJX84_006574 [Apatococcus fuscideae]|uniref:tetrahydrofolate synthase n=1 Tax=Apatococcus fuscideae TaxID=2026836 RepID=A0AAW1T6Z1_9CHLO